MSSLSKVWSIDGSCYATHIPYIAHLASAAPAPADFDSWFVSSIIMNRYCAYYISRVLETIPSSETRLRSEGLGVMYNNVREIDVASKAMAQQRGIPVPNCADIAADWKDEKADYNTLHAVLSAHAIQPVNQYIANSNDSIHAEGRYHWASLVAPLSVSTDFFADLVPTESEPVTSEMLAQKEQIDNSIAGAARVMREELMKVRSRKEETGWKEEEAKQLTTEYVKCMRDFFASWSQFVEGGLAKS